MAKVIFVVTHGDKFSGANPRMTPEGFKQVTDLRRLLPRNPSVVLCGTGTRHFDVVSALDLWTLSGNMRVTSVIGGPDSLEVVNGEKLVVLANGKLCSPAVYTTLEDSAAAAVALVASLPDNSVVCAGRPLMIMLSEKNAKSAAVYKITVTDVHDEITSFDIEEVVATGVAEKGTV